MNMQQKMKTMAGALCVLALGFTACQKSDDITTSDELTTEASTIAVAATASTSGVAAGGTTDSVYLLHGCRNKSQMAATSLSAMPASVSAYLDANYSGYTLFKALSVSDSSNTLQAYIVVVYYNEKPVGLKFDAAGNFVQVLEQRERGDIGGKGWHNGGRFRHRNGLMKDTVALSAIPANILSGFTASYASDTLVKAFKSADSGYVLLSRNNGVFATAYNASGIFVNRVAMHEGGKGQATAIEASALPAAITNYLTTTYPGYVFNKAFSLSVNGTVKGYVVVIDANNTRYGLSFDSGGNFIAAKTIR